jgi:hypothetical protein
MSEKLIQFLQQELNISLEQIELALRQVRSVPHQLPMVLWQYGLVNLWQLERIFDWLESA